MRFLEHILRRSGLVLVAWVVLAVAMAPGLGELGHDNSPEVFFVRDDEALARYHDFVTTFGDHGALRIVVRGPGLWTGEGLAWLERIERRAPTVPGVLAAAGPWGARRPETRSWPPADVGAYRFEATSDALSREAGWVSHDGEVATVLLALRRLTATERRDLLTRLAKLVAERPPGLDVQIAGLAAVNRALDRELRAILGRLFPLVVALGAATIALCLRSFADTALLLLFTAFCQTVLFGGMGYAGVSLNIVTAILPLLLFVLALATGVHILLEARAQSRAGLDAHSAVLATWRRKGWSVLWTAATTGIGFGSLAASRSPPVRALGSWAALGIALVLLAAFTLYPALLARARRPAASREGTRFEQLARGLGGWSAGLATGRPRTVHAVFGLLLLAALAGLPRLRVESGFLRYFEPGHPVRITIEELEADGIAAVSAELVVRLPEGGLDQSESLRRLGRLSTRVRSLPGVLGVVGRADLPAGEEFFLRRARELTMADDGTAARLTLFVPFSDHEQLARLIEQVETAAREIFPEAASTVTGHYPMVLAAQRHLLSTMAQSLGVTVLTISALLMMLTRGGRLALVAVAPNLWPVALALGAMGWLGVRLDNATVMLAAVVLGVAVDDTLHYLGGLRLDSGGRSPTDAARSTLRRLAPAHLLTTLVLVLGLGVLGASSFVPVARFGALTAFALGAALAADLLWVPALTAGLDERGLARLARGRS